ncbi:MAG: DUF4105 domain-containing protein [Bdellovibrionota bacterium]
MKAIFVFLIALVVVSPASALEFRTDPNAPDIATVTFFEAVRGKLPSKVLDHLPDSVTVRFDGNFKKIPLSPPQCGGLENAPDAPQKFAYTSRGQIFMNPAWLPVIQAGRTTAETFPCKHGNLYDLAAATLIHELGHLYDQKTRISQDRRFRALTDWVKTPSPIPNWKQKNQNAAASADTYEWRSPRESFAVNLEYFLLDPEFPCRRPLLYRYFLGRMGAPVRNSSCVKSSQWQVSTSDGAGITKKLESIDPARVFRIDYFQAMEAKALMSRWGHSMFRVIVCAPTRPEVGPECLNDVAHHRILSFRANVEDLKINQWKGVFGGYPSLLFVLKFTDVLDEYTRREFRDVASHPLALDRSEIADFIDRALEANWSYAGNYKFMSRNCATESYQLLRPIVGADLLLQDFITTPEAIARHLRDLGLIREPPTLFKSKRDSVEKAFAKFQTNGLLSETKFENWIARNSAAGRRILYEVALMGADAPLLASAYLVENQAYYRTAAGISREFAIRVTETGTDPSGFLTTDTNPLQIPGGYGLPLAQEIIFSRPGKTESPKLDLIPWMKEQLPDSWSDFEACLSNLAWLRTRMLESRETMKQGVLK